jgi:SnoaL-like domain
VEPSEEVRLVVTRLVESVAAGDAEALRVRMSLQPGFERFGSDRDEWWQDGEASTLVWIQQMAETGASGFPWRLVSPVHAMVEGIVAWAGARATFETPQGEQPLRMTYVLHLEHGEWKIVQAHHSVPSPNEAHGFMLTTSAYAIVRSIAESRVEILTSSAPDGTVTLMFTDVEDSTQLNAFLGDQRWLAVLRAHNETVA